MWQNVSRPTKAAVNVQEDWTRAAEFQEGLTVCCVHWDEIRRGSNTYLFPRGNHSWGLRKQRISGRLMLFWMSKGRHVMCTSQVQGGATNATQQWRNKVGLPRILTTSRQCYELLNNKHRLLTDVCWHTGCYYLGLLQGFSESPFQKIKWNWGKGNYTLSKIFVATTN